MLSGPLAKDGLPIWGGTLASLCVLTSKCGCPILEEQGDELPKVLVVSFRSFAGQKEALRGQDEQVTDALSARLYPLVAYHFHLSSLLDTHMRPLRSHYLLWPMKAADEINNANEKGD